MKSILLSIFFIAISTFSYAQHRVLDSLAKTHYQKFIYENGNFKGDYLDSLINKISKHQYVLIGEQHHSNEIPAFVQYLIKKVDYDNYIMEGNQSTTDLLRATYNHSVKEYKNLLNRFQDRFGFYTFSQDRSILEYFFSKQKEVIELDQVFASSDAPLLDFLYKSTRNEKAKLIYRQLFEKAEQQWKVYSKNPNVQPPFKDEHLPLLCAASFKDDIQLLQSLDLSEQEQLIIEDLAKSNDIYRTAFSGEGYKSHEMRIGLMKNNLLDNLNKIKGHKNLFKFGANHVTKHKSLLQDTPDVGNLVLNIADSDNEKSLHIALMEKKGSVAGLFGEAIETNGLPYLKAFTDIETAKNEWLIFDLNDLNKKLSTKDFQADHSLKNFMEGYDYLIIIPEVTPQIKGN
ncbi:MULTISPECIES: hypothetical protein [Sphingobacterium]|uniref:Erythromycin esterase family protein n=1 Tax=Sphingobacterium tenebrionis TaxID=3111775 RepID=A0ABU8I6J5_9SPHI|nr:hypothetical protein [Sphingobacterium sp. CZ-2]QBR11395.1 hypothetical protein E3D81_04075 [Sphingobacterium sp. CZ-2]